MFLLSAWHNGGCLKRALLVLAVVVLTVPVIAVGLAKYSIGFWPWPQKEFKGD